jgi:hypothetical protein
MMTMMTMMRAMTINTMMPMPMTRVARVVKMSMLVTPRVKMCMPQPHTVPVSQYIVKLQATVGWLMRLTMAPLTSLLEFVDRLLKQR